jgi:hypothetical protein
MELVHWTRIFIGWSITFEFWFCHRSNDDWIMIIVHSLNEGTWILAVVHLQYLIKTVWLLVLVQCLMKYICTLFPLCCLTEGILIVVLVHYMSKIVRILIPLQHWSKDVLVLFVIHCPNRLVILDLQCLLKFCVWYNVCVKECLNSDSAALSDEKCLNCGSGTLSIQGGFSTVSGVRVRILILLQFITEYVWILLVVQCLANDV